MRRANGTSGFTLIELVMVIVILGILAAVAIPRFVDLQDDARNSAALGEIGALRSAATTYYAEQAISGNAVFPADKSALEALLMDSLTVLSPANTSYDWSYDSTTGTIQSSGWPS